MSRPGGAATQLAWEALRNGLPDLAHAAAQRLRRSPAPQLIPIWTTEHTNVTQVAFRTEATTPTRVSGAVTDRRSGERSTVTAPTPTRVPLSSHPWRRCRRRHRTATSHNPERGPTPEDHH